MNPGTTILVIALSLLSATGQAGTVDEIVAKIDYNQSLGIAYMLTAEEIEQLEQSSDPTAHYYLGLAYAEGDTPNTARDQCKAAEHILIAANDGYPYANLYLAYAHIWGIGVNRNLEFALARASEAQKRLISARLKDVAVNSNPYNFEAVDELLQRSLRCSGLIREKLPALDSDVTPSTNNPVIVRPCIESNVIAIHPQEFRNDSSNSQYGWYLERSDLVYWCSPSNRMSGNSNQSLKVLPHLLFPSNPRFQSE